MPQVFFVIRFLVVFIGMSQTKRLAVMGQVAQIPVAALGCDDTNGPFGCGFKVPHIRVITKADDALVNTLSLSFTLSLFLFLRIICSISSSSLSLFANLISSSFSLSFPESSLYPKDIHTF